MWKGREAQREACGHTASEEMEETTDGDDHAMDAEAGGGSGMKMELNDQSGSRDHK